MLKNCPVTVEDIDNAEKIYGRSTAALKGKVTRHKSEVVSTDYVEVPKIVLSNNKELTLCADIMYIQ